MKFLGAKSPAGKAKIIISGVCFDKTSTFRSGSAQAPDSIRDASQVLETYSFPLHKDLNSVNIHDAGDIGPFDIETQAVIEKIKSEIGKFKECFIITLGGEHLITFPIVESLRQKKPELKVLQFDAHRDLLNNYEGNNFSHATVARRVAEKIGNQNLYQVGIRSSTPEEENFASQWVRTLTWPEINNLSISEPLYLTIDMDVFDPGVAPGVGNPEPGGIFPQEFFKYFYKLQKLNIVGLDLVEVCPQYDAGGITAILAAKIVRESILLFSGP